MSGKRRAAGPAVTKKPQRPLSRRDRAKKAGKWVLIVGLVCSLLGVAAFAVAYAVTDVPDPNEDFQTQTSFVYYDDGKTELGRYATQNRESISLDEMPASIKDAVVAAENRSFWTDRGIDPRGILRAAFSNAQGNATQGASTITQQYVKILYLTQEQTLERKVKEAMLSLKLHRQQSKTQILEGYLNTIYFGRGAYGVQAAAKAFFDVEAKDLDLRQSAVLATVLNNPSKYDPANGKQARQDLKARYDYVLSSMADTGAISAGQADRAQRRLPKFPKIQAESQFGGQRGHVLTMVRDELVRLGFTEDEIEGGGLRVTTTFSKKAMDAAEQGVLEAKPEGFGDKFLHIGVASVEPGTGAVRGIYGGQDYLDSQINWAVSGGQAGSTMKPSALVAAIRDGFSLKDTFEGNSPIVLDDGTDFENQGDSGLRLRDLDGQRHGELREHRVHRHDRQHGERAAEGPRRRRGPRAAAGEADLPARRPASPTRAPASSRPPVWPSAARRSARSTSPTPTPRSPTRDRPPSRTSSRRSSTATVRPATPTRSRTSGRSTRTSPPT